MATAAFEELVKTFEFLDAWEDRYRHVIELGKAFRPMDEALKVPATKVQGCASQVWIQPMIANGCYDFQGDSDAMIVKGLIAILHALYAGVLVDEVGQIDAPVELARLGLIDHLSAQRSNGLRSMLERIYKTAAES
ncbi:MAG: SufE family protein [Rhodobacteraceae bacterium]|nr:SufE family protein [Paracoccaceae bacterium]